jgi:hypothetical protein
MGPVLVRIARLACAGLGIAAIVSAVTATIGSLGNFFSYFTIESNMLAIVVLIVGGPLGPQSRDWAYLRGAATLFMVITGIVYAVLLTHAEVGLTAAWVNHTLHRVIPLVMLADWIFFPPWSRGSLLAALGWLIGPLAYFAYSLARVGSCTGTRIPSSTPGIRVGTGGSRCTLWCSRWPWDCWPSASTPSAAAATGRSAAPG